jgi:hypothetical protein
VEFVVDKEAFSPSISDSVANSHSTGCPPLIIIMYHPAGTLRQVLTDVPHGLTPPREKLRFVQKNVYDFKEKIEY